MSVHESAIPVESTLYRGMFATDEMCEIFTHRRTVTYWLAVEASLARSQALVGLIPRGSARRIASVCRAGDIDMRRLFAGTRRVGYPILPLVEQIARAAGDAGSYVHWGATTQDIMDTALALQIRDTRRLVVRDATRLITSLEGLARSHRRTVMAGRTHGQHAVPVTFGFKLAVFVAELRRHLQRLDEAASRNELIQLAGAAGTLASMGGLGLVVQKLMAQDLRLTVPPIAWHTSRDGPTEFVFHLALLSTTLTRLAQEVAQLQRTECGELEEAFVPGRGASSTMPQKRNPITSETIIGTGHAIRQYVPAMLDGMLHDGERATGAWHVEWLTLPQVAIMAHAVVTRSRELVEGLVVHPDRMRRNLDLGGGLISSEAIMMALAPRIGRQSAHHRVYEACMRAIQRGTPFRQELLRDPVIANRLGAAELDRLLVPDNYVGLAPLFVSRVLGRRSQPVRRASRAKARVKTAVGARGRREAGAARRARRW